MNIRQLWARQNIPPTIQDAASGAQAAFALGRQHHQSGNLADAERQYREALAIDPKHADSMHLLGVAAIHTGRPEMAIDMIRKAIAINGTIGKYHSNLGNVLAAQGQLDEAVDCYRRAILLDPDLPETQNNLANALRQRSQLDEAVIHYRRAIGLKPDFMEAHFNLANTLKLLDRLDELAACYGQIVCCNPRLPGAHANLGTVFFQLGRFDEAATCFRKAIELKPDMPEAYNSLGVVMQELELLESAIFNHQMAIKLNEDYPEAYNNLANALRARGDLDDAVTNYRRAIDLRPCYPEAHNNIGNALRDQGHLDSAVTSYRRAIELNPNYADAQHNLALALLARGDMAEGWRIHEWRWKTSKAAHVRRDFDTPQWRGEKADDLTLLIHAEQGFGDTLQFCRYAPLAAARGLHVVLEVPKPLVRLLGRLSGVDLAVAAGEELPPFDLHCPMLSMPLALGTTLETVPITVPYLHAEEAQAESWSRRLTALGNPNPRIGLVWAGSDRLKADRRRSLAPERLTPLLNLPGLHFLSLQKGVPRHLKWKQVYRACRR